MLSACCAPCWRRCCGVRAVAGLQSYITLTSGQGRERIFCVRRRGGGRGARPLARGVVRRRCAPHGRLICRTPLPIGRWGSHRGPGGKPWATSTSQRGARALSWRRAALANLGRARDVSVPNPTVKESRGSLDYCWYPAWRGVGGRDLERIQCAACGHGRLCQTWLLADAPPSPPTSADA